MEVKIEERGPLKNQFILFYTLRELWKLCGKEMSGLYKLLFPSKNQAGGNKTKYDNILRLQDVNLSSESKRLEDLTGLSEVYIIGERSFVVGQLGQDEWSRFIYLRKRYRKSDAGKSDELKQIEQKIKREIKGIHMDPGKQNNVIKKLLHFAQYGKKEADKTLQDKFKGIEGAISEVHPLEFQQTDLEALKAHQEKVQRYLQHITAALTMQQWEKEQK